MVNIVVKLFKLSTSGSDVVLRFFYILARATICAILVEVMRHIGVKMS